MILPHQAQTDDTPVTCDVPVYITACGSWQDGHLSDLIDYAHTKLHKGTCLEVSQPCNCVLLEQAQPEAHSLLHACLQSL